MSLIKDFKERKLKVRLEREHLNSVSEKNSKQSESSTDAESSEVNSNYLRTSHGLEVFPEEENVQPGLDSLFSGSMQSNLDELEEISDSEDLLCAISTKKAEPCDTDE